VNAEMFGATVKYSPMKPPKPQSHIWEIDFEALEAKFTDKTRFLVLNSPNNPTGKVLQPAELDKLTKILAKHPRCLVLSDEVYEHMIYSQDDLPRIGSYPGMWEKTITMYSLGKTFSCTGWRIGFSVGDERLIKPLIASQQWLNFNVNRPAQVAMAKAMQSALLPYENSANYYEHMGTLFKRKRNELVDILKKCPLEFNVLEPEGGYFVMADISKSAHKIPIKYFYKEGASNDRTPVGNGFTELKNPNHSIDYAYCLWMTHDIGVTPLPVSFFFDNHAKNNVKEYQGTNFLRFAICKNDQTYKGVRERLLNFKF